MATGPIFPKNGAVTFPTGFTFDAQDFRVSESQPTENTTPFANASFTGLYCRNSGSGTPSMSASINGFGRFGASTSGDQPGFSKMEAANTGDAGTSATLTVTTSCTLIGVFVATNLSLSISRIKAGVPCSLDLLNGGDITTTWA